MRGLSHDPPEKNMLDSHSASLCHAGERMLHLAGTERFSEQQKGSAYIMVLEPFHR
jgi:hypothetical protein